jgi:hypothetical protein
MLHRIASLAFVRGISMCKSIYNVNKFIYIARNAFADGDSAAEFGFLVASRAQASIFT